MLASNKVKLVIAGFVATLLTACGGSGGSDGGGVGGTVTSTSTFPLFTIHVNTIQASSNVYSYIGTVDGLTFTGAPSTVRRNSLTPLTMGDKTVQLGITYGGGSIRVNGQNFPYKPVTISYYDLGFLPLGTGGGDHDLFQVDGSAVIPTTVRVNDAGTLYTAKKYDDGPVLLGSQTVSYIVEADTAETALLTFIYIEKDTSNLVTSTITRQMRITPSGSFTRTKDTLISGTATVTATYN